ncbi:MAG TPA: hypothetical protein VGM36_03220 [Rhizomicrobium sp.]
MTTSPIKLDAAKEAHLRKELSEEVDDISQSLYTEIQDDGDFFLVHIFPKPEASRKDIENALAGAKRILQPAIPPQIGRYSWMVVVSKELGGPADYVEFAEMLPREPNTK